jgi:hypothetical protein
MTQKRLGGTVQSVEIMEDVQPSYPKMPDTKWKLSIRQWSRRRAMSTDNVVICAGLSYSSVHCLFKWRDGAFDSDLTWQGLGSEDELPEHCSCSAIGDTPSPEPLKNIALTSTRSPCTIVAASIANSETSCLSWAASSSSITDSAVFLEVLSSMRSNVRD